MIGKQLMCDTNVYTFVIVMFAMYVVESKFLIILVVVVGAALLVSDEVARIRYEWKSNLWWPLGLSFCHLPIEHHFLQFELLVSGHND